MVGVQAIVLAVNKMDLVDWDVGRFEAIAREVDAFVEALPHPVPVTAIPISALLGDNVVDRSEHTPWYDGPALLDFLEEFETRPHTDVGARLHVQRVIRPHGGPHADFRGQAGVVSGGWFRVGDAVTVLPGGRTSTIEAIQRWGAEVAEAGPGHAVVVQLATDVDVARGDVLAATGAIPPVIGDDVVVDLCWMIDRPLTVGSRWWFKHGTRSGHAVVAAVQYHLHAVTLEREQVGELGLNDLGRVRLQLSETIVADQYHVLPESGRMILIDPADNTTAAAAMVHEVLA
jgi:sulfate adenylyltransferase subunit 1 (EFTu-like GTPase family)